MNHRYTYFAWSSRDKAAIKAAKAHRPQHGSMQDPQPRWRLSLLDIELIMIACAVGGYLLADVLSHWIGG